MKILYIPSGHPLQEADDILNFEELGYEWFSTGYYANSEKPGDLPYIRKKENPEIDRLFKLQQKHTFSSDAPNTLCGLKNVIWTGQNAKNKLSFSEDFISHFDVILVSHFIENVSSNWNIFKNKKVILKTYGMHMGHQEDAMGMFRKKGLYIVRNSNAENLRYKDKYCGADAIIRGSVVRDEREISGWHGFIHNQICTFCSFFDSADNVCRSRRKFYNTIKSALKKEAIFKMWGAGNITTKFISHKEKINVMRASRANLVVGTPGSNNTYSFVESWIMGMPTVVFGKNLWNSSSYEIDQIAEHNKNVLIGETVEECIEYIRRLTHDYDFAEYIGQNGRAAALPIFGRASISEQWRKFLCTL